MPFHGRWQVLTLGCEVHGNCYRAWQLDFLTKWPFAAFHGQCQVLTLGCTGCGVSIAIRASPTVNLNQGPLAALVMAGCAHDGLDPLMVANQPDLWCIETISYFVLCREVIVPRISSPLSQNCFKSSASGANLASNQLHTAASNHLRTAANRPSWLAGLAYSSSPEKLV